MTEKPKEKSKWSRYSGESRLGVRLLIALCFLLALTFFIYSHGWWLSFSSGDRVSNGDLLAQVDPEALEDGCGISVARMQDMGVVYRLRPQTLETKRLEIGTFLAEDRRWQLLFPDHPLEEMDQLQDAIFAVLLDARFSDLRIWRALKSLGPSEEAVYHCLPSSLREGVAVLPQNFWEDIQDQVLDNENFYFPLVAYAVDDFWRGAYPLEEDTSMRDHVREIVGRIFSVKNQVIQDETSALDREGDGEVSRLVIHRSLGKVTSRQRGLSRPLFLLSSFIFAMLTTFLGWLYLRMSHKKVLQSVKKLCLYVTIIILTLVLSKMADFFLPRHTDFFSMIRYPLYVPFAALLIAILLNAELALFSVFVLTVILALFLVANPNHFLVSNFTAGILAVLSCRGLRKRKKVFGICTKIWTICTLVFFAYNISLDRFWGFNTFIDSLVAFAYLFLTSIFIISFLPLFESIFAIMTDVTLMEYMNPNNELLRRLSIEAPGTYQHCLVVGSIAEAAAQAIGANGLFCRVSTLYHDIGKLFNPHYFTENQMGGLDIHQLLTPLESTQVIIDHVNQGEALARKHKLPQSFIDVIKEHHGHTLVYYFYCKQVEQMGGDKTAVDESQFRYSGPNPSSKESAIIMMADTLEAASRSLETVSEESIIELVESLIGEKLRDGQFKNCELNFKELEVIKQTMVKTLVVARHLRIKYPEKKLNELS